MQCKSTFTERFTLSTPLVCTGRASIINLLSEMFSKLRLSENAFSFHKLRNIPFFDRFLQISYNLRINQRSEKREQ